MVIFIKTIGIIIRVFKENDKSFIGVREELFKKLYKYNVNVIGIPINNDFDKIKEAINLCDGIILSGGDNFFEQDFLVIDYLYKNDIPTFGICLGMQGMARCFSEYEEINVLNHLSNQEYVHYVTIEKNSLLFKIIGQDKILVNSRHKSAIIDTKLNVVALSEDGILEAVEDNTKKFFLGVEWHPESLTDQYSKKLFDYFINTINNKNTNHKFD